MRTIVQKLQYYLKKVSLLGISKTETESSNRVTIFTNLMVVIGVSTGTSLCLQIHLNGISIVYCLGIIGVILVSLAVLLLNHRKKYFQARCLATFTITAMGWNSILVFGGEFHGEYSFFVGLIYSILAFSDRKNSTRLFAASLVSSNLAINDLLQYQEMESITGLVLKDFPVVVLVTNSLLFAGLVGTMIWVEKNKADSYEADLKLALSNIKKEKQRIQVIFDNVSQGIITVNQQLAIEPDYSSFTDEIFPGKNLAGQDLIDSILSRSTLSADELQKIKTSIEFSLGEDELNWEMNKVHLPKDLTIVANDSTRCLDLNWSPIIENSQVTQVILSVTDVTEKMQANQLREESEKQTLMTQAIFGVIAHCGVSQLTEINVTLENIVASLKSGDFKKNRLIFSRDLHSLKGEARLVKLNDLANEIHLLESEIANQENIEENTKGYAKSLSLFLKASNKITSSIRTQQENSWSLLSFAGALKERTKTQMTSSNSLANEVTFYCEDAVNEWPVSYIKPVQQILLHSVQNCIDHGYILPKLDRKIEIKISAQMENQEIKIQIEDCGAGLNMTKIISKWESLPEDQKSLYPQPLDLLFSDNLSTATEVSLTSGRGVGLAAVKATVDNIGGRVSLSNNADGPGTCLTTYLPLPQTAKKAA